MGIVKCDRKLHFYNVDAYPACPFCAEQSSDGAVAAASAPKPAPWPTPADQPRTRILLPGPPKKKKPNGPVVGWLIITRGPGCGRNFRLTPGDNHIGRSHYMDVCLNFGADSDNTISRESHAVVWYDNNANEFFIERGGSRNLPTVNGKRVRRDLDLNPYDLIQLGDTQLMFFPENTALHTGVDPHVSVLSSNTQSDFGEGLRRFRREAQLMGEFDHPNVVEVIGLFDANDTAYFVMEHVDIQSLQDKFEDLGRPLTEAEIQQDLLPTLNGLQAVHDKDIRHLNIQPDYTLTSQDGQPQLRSCFGTGYTIDIYAVGISLYKLMAPSVELPDSKDRQAAELGGLPDPLPPIRDVAPGYSDILYQTVEACTQPPKLKRPQNIVEVTQLLEGSVAESQKPFEAWSLKKNCRIESSRPEPTIKTTPASKPQRLSYNVGGVEFDLVLIPAGRFLMGSYYGGGGYDVERPDHIVEIAEFYMMETAVTFALWDAYVLEVKGVYNPSDFGWGRGMRPVIDVSWNDITQDFIPWLNQKTGRTFRLPSESEWEYACRAGTTTKYSFGDSIDHNQANFYGSKTAPVKNYPPNAFGLYDMHGNVWEWTQDCWNGSYDGAPKDGSAWQQGDCSHAMVRGGSWFDQFLDLRSANRSWGWRSERLSFNGFRLVQDS